jgi:ABC-2 type transport system ATP-binding protein
VGFFKNAMSDPVVVNSLSHSYGSRRALDHISLAVSPGEIFGFLGPNGSGKTTLFRILSTLIAPQATGQAFLFGLDLATHRTSVRSRIGVVFQSPSLDKQLTAEENLRCHGHLFGLRGADLQARIDDLLARVNLSDRRHERVERFSGGMRRRVEIAKGLLNHPDLLLLDEPSTGLDPAARIDLWRLLGEIQKSPCTILLTTHLMDEADRCSRLAILDCGRLVAADTPAKLKSQIRGDVLTLQIKEPATPAQVVANLKAQLALDAEPLDRQVRLEHASGAQLVPRIIEALPGQIDAVTVGPPSLEDVFVHLTRRAFRDAGEGN